MNATQRFALFNLVVIAITLLAAAILYPVLGKGALGAFGMLGFLGFGTWFFRAKKTGDIQPVLVDERDRKIQARAWFFAYALFWLVFVLAAVVATAWVYGMDGAVPVQVIQSSVFVAMMLVYATASIAMLCQYGWGGSYGE